MHEILDSHDPLWSSYLQSEPMLDDFLEFARLQKQACDIDPLYPVLKYIFEKWYGDLDSASALWAVMVYVAYYNAPSALTVLHSLPAYAVPRGDAAKLPTGIERRGLRGGTPLTRHLAEVYYQGEFYGDLKRWLQEGWARNIPQDDWDATRRQAMLAWGNGRWATYKLAEVLQKVLGWPIQAGDMGMDGASGPKQGLQMLFGHNRRDGYTWKTSEFEAQGRWLWHRAALQEGIEVDLAEIETCLCDYHGMMIGRYFVGHDVGLLYEDTHKLEDGPTRRVIIEAAEAVLPAPYWRPIEPKRRSVYTKTGRMPTYV